MTHEDSSCRDKRRYITELVATGEAASINEQVGFGLRMSVYACAHCRGWHLTSHGSVGVAIPLPMSPKTQDPQQRRRWDAAGRERERRKHGKKRGHGRPKW